MRDGRPPADRAVRAARRPDRRRPPALRRARPAPAGRGRPIDGYRRYRREQIGTARLIGRLRGLEVPLDEIRAVLAADDAVAQRELLDRHRRRVEARTYRLQRALHVLGQLSQGKEPIMARSRTVAELDRDTERQLAADLFNHVWTLLETPDRTPEQVDEMIHAAHASRHHWGVVGGPEHRARGEWQCSRVYAVLGRAEPSRWHARRCVDICEEHGIGDWDIAGAYEAMARAELVAGDEAAAREWARRARAACAAIADEDDREPIAQDIASLGLD